MTKTSFNSRRSRRAAKTETPAAPAEVGDVAAGRKWLLVVFLLALAYRAVCFASAGGHPLFRYPIIDAGYHHAWAERIVAGDRLGHGPDDVFKPPLYAYFLAGFYALAGPSVCLIQWVQLTLGACSCVLLTILGCRLLGPAAGRIAGLLAALYAPFVFFELQLLTPASSTFLNLTALLTLVPVHRPPGLRRLLAAGVLFGLSAAVRPDVLLPAGLVAGYIFLSNGSLHARRLAAGAACLLLGAALVLAPVTLRNYRITGEFIPVSSNAGINFYVGNAAGADGVTAVPVGLRWERTIAWVPQEILERPAEASRWWTRRAWQEMGDAPGAALLRFGRKMAAMLNAREFRNNICYHFLQLDCPPLRVCPLQFWLILPLAAGGLVALFRARRRAFAICLCWTGGYWFVGVVFFVTARFRLPAVPLLILPAAWALLQIALAIRQQHGKALLGYAAVVLAAGAVCWPNWFGPARDGWVRDCVNRANSLREAKQNDAAFDWYRRALARAPDDPDARYLYGCLFLPGRPDEALRHLEAARAVIPDSPDLLLAIAQAHLARREPAAAQQVLGDLLQLAETSNLAPRRAAWSTAHVLLADLQPAASTDRWKRAWSIDPRTAAEAALLRGRELPRVVETFRAEADRYPWDWYSQANYATALLATGRAEESAAAMLAAVALAPKRQQLTLRFHRARALLLAGHNTEALAILNRLHTELRHGPLRDRVAALLAAERPGE